MSSTQVGLLAQLKERHEGDSLTGAERRVVAWILGHPAAPLNLSASELASATGVSEATIVRTCQRLGFGGYPQFKLALASSLTLSSQLARSPLLVGEVEIEDDLQTIVHKVFDANIQVLRRTKEHLDVSQLVRALDAVDAARRLEVYSSGSQAHLVDHVCAKFINTGIHCVGRVDHLQQIRAAALLEPSDVVLIFSHSGRLATLVQAARLATSRSATTIGVTNFAQSVLARTVDIAIITHGFDLIFYSESMESQVAQVVLVDCLLIGIVSRRRDQALSNILTTRRVVEGFRL